MAKLQLVQGTTSKTIKVFAQSSTTGLAATGLVFNTSGLTCYYIREGAGASVAVSLATATLGTWATGGFIVVDGTNMQGLYEFSIPNLALAAGANSVIIMFQGTNIVFAPIEIELTATNNQDAIHGGMSALPNTACTTNASLLTSGSGTDQISVSSGKVLLQATQTGVTIPTVTTVTNQLTAAQIATGVWQDATGSDFTTASSIGKSLYTSGAAPGAASGLLIAGSNAATTFASLTSTGNFSINGANTTAQSGDGYAVVNSGTFGNSALRTLILAIPTNPYTGTPPTAAQIATAVWQDTTAGDLNVSGSPGYILAHQLENSFTTTSSSVFTVAALANAPSGSGSSPAAIATAVWQDTTSTDFNVANSIGQQLYNLVTNSLTESYAAKGSAPSIAQALMAIYQYNFNRSIAGTSEAVYKLDGATVFATVTLNDPANPTSITRSS